jgi:hypothetical protein
MSLFGVRIERQKEEERTREVDKKMEVHFYTHTSKLLTFAVEAVWIHVVALCSSPLLCRWFSWRWSRSWLWSGNGWT